MDLEVLEIEVSPEQRALLSRAASVLNMELDMFILRATCYEAENVVLNQTVFSLNSEEYERFSDYLNKPFKENAKLKRLLNDNPGCDSQ